MSFDVDEVGERSITTQDILVTDMSVVQFDVRFRLIFIYLSSSNQYFRFSFKQPTVPRLKKKLKT